MSSSCFEDLTEIKSKIFTIHASNFESRPKVRKGYKEFKTKNKTNYEGVTSFILNFTTDSKTGVLGTKVRDKT
jgi:hypothetical protein